ncbi:MAG: magnesium transporter [Gammaproteobacteria bacterium]|nr:magnesium transporter [Gammaproteobacteria bacterium]
MPDLDTSVPLQRVDFEIAAEHATLDVPVVEGDVTAADMRRLLGARHYRSASHLVVVSGRKFDGIIRIEDLLAASDSESAARLMDAQAPVVAPGIDQEVAAWQAVRRGESALAVVDVKGTFVGLIPPDRLLAVLLAEHEEDLSRLGGFMSSTASVRRTTEEAVPRRFGHRLPWLLVGLIGALASADLVGIWQSRLEDRVMIAFFIPAIVYLADAVGTQTETVVVRGLSLGVRFRQMFARETLTGLAIGLSLALVAGPLVLWRWADPQLALAVGLALCAACSTATLVALLMPWGLDSVGVDPAFGSGPLATVVQDLLSILIYFLIVDVMVA